MKELDLVIEFKENHFMKAEGILVIESADKRLIDRQKNFIREKTNATPQMKIAGTDYILEYSFNDLIFAPIIRLIKKYNLGVLKSFRVRTQDFTISKKEIHFDKATVKLDNVLRVFVDPAERKMMFLTVPKYTTHVWIGEDDIDFSDAVQYLNKGTSKFAPYIQPVIDKFRAEKRAVKEKVKKTVGARLYRLILDNGTEVPFSSDKHYDEVMKVCKKIYGKVRELDVLEVKSLDKIVADYNVQVQERIKELQMSKII